MVAMSSYEAGLLDLIRPLFLNEGRGVVGATKAQLLSLAQIAVLGRHQPERDAPVAVRSHVLSTDSGEQS